MTDRTLSIDRVRSWLLGRNGSVATPRSESDVAPDTGVARSRAFGGRSPDGDVADAATTTGTASNQLFVGRIAGDDLGYAGDTGAEIRAQVRLPGTPAVS